MKKLDRKVKHKTTKAKKIKPKQKLAPPTPFEQYQQSLTQAELDELALFWDDMKSHVLMTNEENHKIYADFENALLYYASAGLPLTMALERLCVKNLGGFYARPPMLWYALDDAAKIYPLSMRHGQMSVFRLSVYFRHDVVPELLQMALTFTIKRFPSFATTVKKGFFWHYLDTAKRKYTIEPDIGIPCSPLQISRSGSQSFRVLYYQNRMSVECFHILTDGTGGMIFLKTLTAEYLRLLGVEHSIAEGILNTNEMPKKSETVNEFLRAEKAEEISGFLDKPALQMSGRISKTKPARVLHFKMDAGKLKEAAQKNNTTITAYMLALIFIANKSATDELKGTINIQVPVNMRKFYPSDTLRNFSMYCIIKLPIDDIDDTSSIIEEISNQLTQKASLDSMREMLNSTGQMVKLMRYVPLTIKAPVARAVYGFLGDITFSNTLSNLGVANMPPKMAQQIDCIEVLLGSATTSRASCGLVTFENTAILSITKMTSDPSFEETLFDLLTADGIEPTVEGSERYEN
ncbi:hypothetical protein LJC42_02185 [Eubacteriales bacterium OttesenSCG-928-K08]|nr:hypothetical protein [Eubacteriales bacterium OttesenSCG-928-K08]